MNLLAAFALFAAAQAADVEPYRAVGASPLWQATITDNFIIFETHDRGRMTVEIPQRQESEHGFVYRTNELVLTAEHRDCVDPLNRLLYTDRVTVTAGTASYAGCGGFVRTRGRVAPYVAARGEPFWSLEIADGRLYFGVNDDVWIVPAPVATGDARTLHYAAPGIHVVRRREECQLDDERTYADAIIVTAGQWRVEGCGGRVLREAPED